MKAQPPQTPIMVENPHTGTRVNVAPLLTYLDQQLGSSVAGASGAANVSHHLKRAYRLLATTPINLDLHTPEEVASIINDLFDLEDVFLAMVEPDRME